MRYIGDKISRRKKRLAGIGILLLFLIFLYAGYRLVSYWYAGQESEQLAEHLIEKVVVIPDTPSHETAPDGPVTETAPIMIGFQALRQENTDVIAWIYCEGTPIHYPIVQSGNNSYYLRRLLNGSYNVNGTIFLDYRCSPDFTDFNSIVFGHNMKSGEMFGTLVKYKEQSFYNEHPVMYLLTPAQNYRIDLIAGYVTPSDSATYSMPQNEDEKKAFLEYALQHSAFSSGIEANETDTFITLSTCSYEYDNARYVVIGKLTEIE